MGLLGKALSVGWLVGCMFLLDDALAIWDVVNSSWGTVRLMVSTFLGVMGFWRTWLASMNCSSLRSRAVFSFVRSHFWKRGMASGWVGCTSFVRSQNQNWQGK